MTNALNDIQTKIALARHSPRTAVNYIMDRVFRRQPTPYPRIINLFVTERCNFACPMCHVKESMAKHRTAGDLPFEIIERIITESKPWSPAFQIIGGEPTIYPHLMDVLALISVNGMVCGLTTNGLKLAETASALVDSGLHFLAVSLDGWDEASQMKRGNVKGSFEAVVNGIDKVKKHRADRRFPIIRLATVITPNNFHNLSKIARVVADLKPDKWSLSHYYFVTDEIVEQNSKFLARTGIGTDIWADRTGQPPFDREQIEVMKHELQAARDTAREVSIDFDWSVDPHKFYSSMFPGPKSVCLVPFNELFVRGAGILELCQSYILGRIPDVSIHDAWNGPEARHFRKVFKGKRIMPACFRCCALRISF